MTQYNSVNIQIPDSQFDKSNSAKNETEVTLRSSSNMIGAVNETNFPHNVSFTNT